MMIQPDMKIGSIVRRPEFKGYEHVAGEMPGFMGKMSNHMTIDTMCKMVKTWDAEAMHPEWTIYWNVQKTVSISLLL